MTLVRPKLGVGQKTLIAFSIVFWLPVSVMAAMLFFLTQTQLHNDAISHIKVQLKAAGEVYAERTHQLKGVLNQLSQQQQTQRLFAEKDSQGLREILQGISKENDFVTIVLAVDENRQVIGQRNRVSSDILNINNVLTDALTTGAMTHSTELVSREFLGSENSELKKLFKDVGLVQFVVAPVRLSGKVHGALVVGVLLSDDPWLGNTIYNRFGVQMTLFAGSPSELSFLHSTSSVPHNAWQLWQPLPVLLQEQISHGKPFYGQLPISGIDTTVAFEPLKDSRNRVVGAMGISTESRSINNIALSLIGKAGLVAALLGLLVSIALTLIIHHDITRPLNSLVGAMQRFGKGDLDTEIDLRTGDQLEALGDGFNTMARVICQREERLKKHNRITKLLMSTLDIDELLSQTLKAVLEVTRSHMGVI
ncbi:MAG: HAMP domain-containing protein, partial [Gammaproteobacteria bacterium]|nr:HAMP domain-containing protein [Gammaproteobacteria bacterium]